MPNNLPVPGDTPPATALTPAALDRGALDRVLARAAELNAGQLEPAEGMTEAQLVDLGREVGISPEHIRQALAEERTRVTAPEARGLVGELFGATGAVASRLVAGTPVTLLAALDQWMQREEILRPKRRFADRLTWEGRRDLAGNLQAGLNFSGRAYALKGASEVGATVVAIDAQRCLVRLDADFAESRRTAVGLGGAAATIGTLGGAGLVAWSASIPGASVVIASIVAGGWALGGAGLAMVAGRAQKRRVLRAQVALEQILDRLEHGEIKRPANSLVDLLTTITR